MCFDAEAPVPCKAHGCACGICYWALHRLQSLKSVVPREETKPAGWDPFSLPERRQEAGASRRTGRPGRTGTAERGQLYAPRLRLVLEDVLLPTLSWEPW